MAAKNKTAAKTAYRRAKKKELKEKSQAEPADTAGENASPAPVDNANNDAQAVQAATDKQSDAMQIVADEQSNAVKPVAAEQSDDDIVIDEYGLDDPLLQQYMGVLEKFRESKPEEGAGEEEKPEVMFEVDDIPDEEEEDKTKKKLSKRQRKEAKKMTVAQLKSMVHKPEVVEWTDASSHDPALLLEMKSYKNVIPVPKHWSLKREYLSSKRGIEKAPFALPKFIAETGIAEMRDAVLEKQAEMTLKQKQRERVQGKLGKLDIDYGKLYDAFFRRQTKPEMTEYGDVYYEGKEHEAKLVNMTPGVLSEELKAALGMPPGFPPPWLVAQQRFGPPRAYPNLKVPGVNAPIPPGASWGFAAGQWGKPPIDEVYHRPQWGGDPLGQGIHQEQAVELRAEEGVERQLWGVLRAEGESDEEESDEEEEEDEDEEEENEGQDDPSGIRTSHTFATAMPSEIGGTETIAGEFTLRKQQRRGFDTEEPAVTRTAYQVLPEKNIQSSGFFGGEHAYDLDTARRDTLGNNSQRKRKAGEIEVSVDVDSLAANDRMDKDALRRQYEAQRKAEMQGQWQSIDQDDLSEMIAAESRKRARRDDERGDRRSRR